MKRLDLAGHRYGRWLVLRHMGGANWLCRCDCGIEKPVQRNHLRSGHSQSCGCFKSEVSSASNSAKIALGARFSRLTVIRRHGSERSHDKRTSNALWLCRCDCGQLVTASSWKLSSGYKKSCGCAFTEAVTTHGRSRTREYRIWIGMRQRCENPNHESWPNYGGRGIAVCERWAKFENFLSDMGIAPTRGHTLDRKDANGRYSPSNCQWALRVTQARNTRRNKVVVIDGQEIGLTDAIAMLRARATYKYTRGSRDG